MDGDSRGKGQPRVGLVVGGDGRGQRNLCFLLSQFTAHPCARPISPDFPKEEAHSLLHNLPHLLQDLILNLLSYLHDTTFIISSTASSPVHCSPNLSHPTYLTNDLLHASSTSSMHFCRFCKRALVGLTTHQIDRCATVLAQWCTSWCRHASASGQIPGTNRRGSMCLWDNVVLGVQALRYVWLEKHVASLFW